MVKHKDWPRKSWTSGRGGGNGTMEVIARTVVDNWERNGALEQMVTAGQWRQKLRELRDGACQRALVVTPSSEEGE